jgi:peptidoglycan hydrolase-like protein with peptidoglycan-binding domain
MRKRLSIYLFLVVLGATLPFSAQADFRENLQFGMRGNTQVKELQRFLSDQGVYNGPVTGNFLALTRAAVRTFQSREGLPAVGLFGPQTRARANALLAKRNAATRANLEGQLSVLQEQVQTLEQRLADAKRRESPAATIEPQSLVALNCFYVYLPTGRVINAGKGSGAIIRSDGTILTARHLVDLRYSYRVDSDSISADIALNSTFDHCEVGQISSSSSLPTADEIRLSNPTVSVSALPYKASLMYLPSSANLHISDLEASHLDFALLKITGLGDGARALGITSLPSSFPAANLLRERLQEGDEVLTYGYPADPTPGTPFRTFRLAGGVGRVKNLQVGDLKFLETPLVVNTEMEAQQGRSGSPLFYRGYVAGVVTAHAEKNPRDSYSVSMEAILPILQDVLGI